jgi:catechol 2,3-dioxygenase-like lactoylglutathione lyase family enzyme
MRIHHVNVVVPQGKTETVQSFYVDVLGLRRTPKPAEGVAQTGAWFDVDERTQVHVSERDGVPHPQSHFALVVDDFDGVLARVREAGAPWDEQPDVFGGRRGFTRDPAGNRIELLENAGTLRS